MATAKTPEAKKEAQLEILTPVTQFKIPCRYQYGESPLELASASGAGKTLKERSITAHLEGVIIDDFLVVRNEDCDEIFVIHKDVLKELVEAVA